MTPYHLQIKLLSNSGQLLGIINCYGGQVSVFRAFSPSELKPYQRALCGLPGPERFSISLDDAAFNSQEHEYIGFGEHFPPGEGDLSASSFLEQAGVPESSIYSLLVSYNMEKFAKLPCSSLPACEERRLRLLAATYKTGRVLILNDPFEPISNHWRERFAELLVAYARNKQALVVVTSLSYRPQVWIDNESIARIQVGENIQKTIGFSGASSTVNALVQQVREDAKQSEQQSSSRETASSGYTGAATKLEGWPRSGPTQTIVMPSAVSSGEKQEGPTAESTTPWWSKRLPPAASKAALIFGAVFAVVAGVVLGLKLRSTGDGTVPGRMAGLRPTQPALLKTPHSAAAATQPSVLPTSLPQPTVTALPRIPTTEPSPIQIASLEPSMLLDFYPASIRRPVIEGFEGSLGMPESPGRSAEPRAPRLSTELSRQADTTAPKPVAPKAKAKEASDLLNVLEKASGSGDGLPDQVRPPGPADLAPNEMANLSPEQRREVIRQKFLEAIQRAAEQRR